MLGCVLKGRWSEMCHTTMRHTSQENDFVDDGFMVYLGC